MTAETGLPFLDHMLAQLGRHGLFDLTVRARGDLEVDAHHTVEDVALTLGQAFHEALGAHLGIRRMADALVPLDEALAQVAVDLSGRGYAVCDLGLRGPATGTIDSDLWRHFLESLAQAGRFTLHVRVLAGRNDPPPAGGGFSRHWPAGWIRPPSSIPGVRPKCRAPRAASPPSGPLTGVGTG